MIPYGKQNLTDEDVDAVLTVLKSEFLTQGPRVPQFEAQLAQEVGAKFCFAVNSATSGLHLACLALGLGEGDWLWTSPNTFVASANCGLYCGASVDFVDIDPITLNMCVASLSAKLEIAEKVGRLPKIVVPVHFAGTPCDVAAIYQLSQKYGFKVIEDASHAVGASLGPSKVGSCEFSDITVFSFHPVKIITTGEGGAVTTQNAELAEKISLLRSHGITRNPSIMLEESPPPWYYEQLEVGFNYRMTDIQAALGLSQIKQLELFLKNRLALAERYSISLQGLDLVLPLVDVPGRSSHHLYVVQLPDRVSRLEIFNFLRESGVGVNVHYIPVHLQPVYRLLGFSRGDFPVAERYYNRALTLPLHPGLSFAEQDIVINMLSQGVCSQKG